MKTKIITGLLALLFSFSANAQPGRLFTTDNQLSSSLINQIYQDRIGHIWIATNNGLNVYNGYQMHMFRKNSKDKHEIASNFVNCVMQARNGLLYVGLNNALQVYDNDRMKTVDVKDSQGHKLEFYVNCILQRRNGDILIGTSGWGILKITDNKTWQRIEFSTKNDGRQRWTVMDCDRG